MNLAFTFSAIALLVIWIVLLVLDSIAALIVKWIWGVRFTTSFYLGLLALLIPVIIALYGYCIGRNRIKVKHIEISSQTLPKKFDGYRIVHISDMHLDSFKGRDAFLKRIVERINGWHPDLILFTGDLVTRRQSECNGFEETLSSLNAADGVCSVLGNHDYLYYNRWGSDSQRVKEFSELIETERKLGWNILLDSNIIIRRGADRISIIGVENISSMSQFPSNGNLDKAMEGSDGTWRILLSHDPTHWRKEVIGREIPLTLSGHTHSFQFSLAGWSPSRYIFKEYRGLYKDNNQYLYVNIGLGETLLPLRFGTPPEITLIELNCES